jgi:hypothetical protein
MSASVFGMGGYAYGYADTGGSTACVDATSFCGMGISAAINPPTYSNFGGGIGVNIDQAMGTGTAANSYAPTGAGVTYTLSNLPAAGVRMVIGNGTNDYCAPLVSATGTVTWAEFNTKCYDTPPDGLALTSAPPTVHVEFQVPSVAAAQSWDFCVTALSFAP